VQGDSKSYTIVYFENQVTMITNRCFLGFVLIAGTSRAHASSSTQNDGGLDGLNAFSHRAYQDVERSCAKDVELLCSPNMEIPLMSILSSGPAMLFISSTDFYSPILPEVSEMDQIVNDVFDLAFGAHHSSGAISLLFQNGEESSSTRAYNSVTELDQFIETVPKIHEHLEYSQVELHRRLTEADEEHPQDHLELPFRCRNECLRKAFEQKMVSGECARSIEMLQTTFAMEKEFNRREEEFMSRMVVYITACFALVIVFSRWFRVRHSSSRARLNQKAIAIVYSNPSIRKQVELEIGESVECHGASGKSRFFSKSSNDKKTIEDQEKNLLSTKTICCEGVPVQIV
jgi:hypothetical protein